MNDRKAMQQALEALGWTDEWRPDGLKEQAIAALRERLAQPEQEPPTKAGELRAMKDEFWKQPEQEPVALETVYETIVHWDEGGGKRSRRELARRIVALYTATPQRKPLTDEEALELWNKHEKHWRFENNALAFARAIEAAHGIKGEA